MLVRLFDSIDHAKTSLPDRRPVLVKANSRNICIIRIENEILAFQNECPHQGASLHHGSFNYLGEIVCPLHSFRFNARTGEAIQRSCKKLTIIEVKEIEEQFFLDL